MFRVFHLEKKSLFIKIWAHISISFRSIFLIQVYIIYVSRPGLNTRIDFTEVRKQLWKMTFFGLKYGQDLTGRAPPPPHVAKSTLLLCPPSPVLSPHPKGAYHRRWIL